MNAEKSDEYPLQHDLVDDLVHLKISEDGYFSYALIQDKLGQVKVYVHTDANNLMYVIYDEVSDYFESTEVTLLKTEQPVLSRHEKITGLVRDEKVLKAGTFESQIHHLQPSDDSFVFPVEVPTDFVNTSGKTMVSFGNWGSILISTTDNEHLFLDMLCDENGRLDYLRLTDKNEFDIFIIVLKSGIRQYSITDGELGYLNFTENLIYDPGTVPTQPIQIRQEAIETVIPKKSTHLYSDGSEFYPK